MITAAAQAQQNHKPHAKSAHPGPEFNMPALTGLTDAMALPAQTIGAGPAATAPVAAAASSNIDLSSYIGRSVGSGQCVALVRAAQPSLGPASTWTAGPPVQGNTSLPVGTPIATFDPTNRYANALDGTSHAALYLSQNTQGIQVLDQWSGSPAAIRTIPWQNPGATPANTATAFHVIRPT